MRAQMRGRAQSGEHQDLRRVQRTRGQNHLGPRPDHLDLAAALEFHPGRAAVLDHHPARQPAHDLQVAALQRRAQIGIGRRPAPPLPDRRLHGAEALLLAAVVILRRRIARLLARLDEGIEQRVVARAAGDVQRPRMAAPLGLAHAPALVAVPGLHPLEIGQHIGKAPAIGALLGPMVIIARMPAHIDHPVDRGRPPDHLAPRRRQHPVVQMRLRLRAQAPVVHLHVHRIGERRGHLDEGARIAAPEFHDDHLLARLAQPVGQGRSARARADDDVIRFHVAPQ
jgi:hypothetical protein